MKHNFYIIFSGALILLGAVVLMFPTNDSHTVKHAGLKLDTSFDNQKAQDAVKERVMNELLHPPVTMSSSDEDAPVIHLRKNH